MDVKKGIIYNRAKEKGIEKNFSVIRRKNDIQRPRKKPVIDRFKERNNFHRFFRLVSFKQSFSSAVIKFPLMEKSVYLPRDFL